MDSYIGFWFGRHHLADGHGGQGGDDVYSSWIISSAVARAQVVGAAGMDLLVGLLPQLTQWPVQPKSRVLVLRRALLTLQVNPVSLYRRCGKSDFKRAGC